MKEDTLPHPGADALAPSRRTPSIAALRRFAPLLALAGALGLAAPALAGPLDKNHVGADAKWLLHLDVDQLHKTQLGRFLGDEILDKQLAKAQRDLEVQLNIQFDWRQIHALTAWGAQFNDPGQRNGVLVIKSSFDFAKALDSAIERISQAVGADHLPLKRTQTDTTALYTFRDEVFGTSPAEGVFVLSKSLTDLEKAREVVAGRAPRLASTKAFGAMPDTSSPEKPARICSSSWP
jgi:hypothetical protein